MFYPDGRGGVTRNYPRNHSTQKRPRGFVKIQFAAPLKSKYENPFGLKSKAIVALLE